MTTDELRALLAANPPTLDSRETDALRYQTELRIHCGTLCKQLDDMEAERDTARRTRDDAQAASNRDLEVKRIAERLLIDSRNIQEAEKKILIAAVEKNSTLRTHVKLLREALEKIRRTPVKPFPDSAAHSERAFSNAVWEAWSDIQRKAKAALDATKGEG